MSNKTNVVEELTFEEYWERYSCASDTPLRENLRYSTVTLLARLRGLSTSVPFTRAT